MIFSSYHVRVYAHAHTSSFYHLSFYHFFSREGKGNGSTAHMLFMALAHKLSFRQARNVDDPHLLPFNRAIFRPRQRPFLPYSSKVTLLSKRNECRYLPMRSIKNNIDNIQSFCGVRSQEVLYLSGQLAATEARYLIST